MEPKPSIVHRLKTFAIGRARNLYDPTIFHKISLIAFFAWVGLGADGLSSSCYGPQEAFITLGKFHFLGIFVALGTAFTIMVISTSYSQTIELFPGGGGGYLVASKLHSPSVGMISGCALLIDYVLTISVSIAAGSDALFSFFPLAWQPFKIWFAFLGVIALILMNLRGVKESVLTLAPIFLTFVLTHAFVIVYAIVSHLSDFSGTVQSTVSDVNMARAELGFFGITFLILRAYSMGAGTFTGIEAVSNGLPILREPRVRTGKRTMRFMAISLAVMAVGLMCAFFLFRVAPQNGKTLNAVLFENVTVHWGTFGYIFVLITLISEAAILFVAAQAGFIDGPRILSNMALDRWVPTKFSMLSDRLVMQNGIFLMGLAAMVVLFLSHGRVEFLIILYSINVFITFVLTESGMVKHWWQVRHQVKNWLRKLSVNGIALILDVFILLTVVIIKFHEGGWITLLITSLLIGLILLIKRHYNNTRKLFRKLDDLVATAEKSEPIKPETGPIETTEVDPTAKTAVILVNGFNGLGLHTLFTLFRLFSKEFKNFVFVQVGVVDAGNFKGAEQIGKLKEHIENEVSKYIAYMKALGFYAEGFMDIGTDTVDEVMKLAPKIMQKFPKSIFFGGQLAFAKETFLTRSLHNNIVFAVQRRFYHQGIPFFILPIRV
jgi:amino acid transporter